jgi:two-component system, OmpR family, sensor histidine kinase VicK
MATVTESKDSVFSDIERIGKLSKDGVFVYHIARDQFTYINRSLVKIIEISKKVLMDDPKLILTFLVGEDQEYVKSKFHELLQNDYLEDAQVRLVQNKVGKVLSFNCYLSADRSGIIGFVRDITKPKEHEDYLINFGAKKDSILDMVSQNLSTPLNLSKFTVDLIDKAVKEKKYDKLNSHIKLMREVTSECIRIIGDFMKEEHLESPGVHTKANRFDLMAKVRIVLDQLKQAAPEKRMKLKTDVNHLFITGDDVKYFQILHNILSNSMKFTKPNGNIEVTVKTYKNKFEIVIKDDGVGIPADLQPFIFEKETRAARPGLKGEPSNGIGLYIVHELTGLLGGSISFESNEKKGTKFTLEFPKN